MLFFISVNNYKKLGDKIEHEIVVYDGGGKETFGKIWGKW